MSETEVRRVVAHNGDGVPSIVHALSTLADYWRRCACWLTAASRPIAKRDFEKLGITNPREQLKQPIPKWLRLQVQVGLQADDSGIERNSVLAFKVLERIQPEADPFAPESEGGR